MLASKSNKPLIRGHHSGALAEGSRTDLSLTRSTWSTGRSTLPMEPAQLPGLVH